MTGATTGLTTGEARIIYATGHGPRSLPVRFCSTVEKHLITLRLPEYNEATHYLEDQDVVVELPISDTHERLGLVRVHGHATVVPDDEVPDRVAARLEHWPAGIVSRFVAVSIPASAGSTTGGSS